MNPNLSPYQFSTGNEFGSAHVYVHVKGKKREGVVGQLEWNMNPSNKTAGVGEITSAVVHPDHQRIGMATEMMNRANKYASKQGIMPPHHAPEHKRTAEGLAWSEAIGNG